jgi:hypothetical protein
MGEHKMNCLAEGMLKTFMVICNTVVLLSGLTLLFVGVISFNNIEALPDFVRALQLYYTGNEAVMAVVNFAPHMLIAFGSFLTLVAFLGCCGSCSESRCMLATYAGLLTLLFLGQIVVGSIAVTQKVDLAGAAVEQIWTKSVEGCEITPIDKPCAGQGYNITACPNYRYRYIVQEVLHCCGLHNQSDAAWNATDSSPYCCQKIEKDGYTDGCFAAVDNATRLLGAHSRLTVAGFALIIIGILQLISIFGAISLYRMINEKRDEETYNKLQNQNRAYYTA